jgi:hypothetical protein
MTPAQDGSLGIAISIAANDFSACQNWTSGSNLLRCQALPLFSHCVVVHPWSGFERHDPLFLDLLVVAQREINDTQASS